MDLRKRIVLLVFLCANIHCWSQEFSIHPEHKIDTVWYSNVTEDSEPDPMSCEEGGIGYYRLKYTHEIVISDFKKDSIITKKEDWEEEDEEDFDKKYNEENKEELEGLEDDFIEEDEAIADLTKEEIERFIDVNWNGYAYNICHNDCESVMQQCYIYHEITTLKDYKKTYKYRTSFSWLEFKDDGNNVVEIDLDLIISYETWIYFFVTCSCDEIPDLVSATPSKLMNDSNPWSKIEVVGERMKPGYPFGVVPKPFPTLPVAGGIVGTGALVYLLTNGEDENPCEFNATIQGNGTKCGDQSGGAMITVNPPGYYTYAWSSGQNTSAINNISSGNYTVTITPVGESCPKMLSITINDEIDLPQNSVSTVNAECGKENGSASIDNPSSDQTYQWSDGSNGTSVSTLGVGNHTVTVTEGTCSLIIDFTIMEDEANFSVSESAVQPDCGKENGSINLSVSPAGNYDYLWSTGDSGSSISSLSAGTFSVTISKTGSTCVLKRTYTLEELPADFMLSFSTEDATCGQDDGAISVTVEPMDDYAYEWSNGENTASLTDITAGDYSVTVTLNGTECSVTGNATIGEKPLSVEIEFIATQPNCGLADGTIEAIVDPPGSYTYEWSNGDIGQQIANVATGDYSVTISDSNGCTATSETSLEDMPIIYVEAIESSPGNCIEDGEITLTLSTPGEGPIVVEVEGPNGSATLFLSAGSHDLSTEVALIPGQYNLTFYDQNAGPECSQSVDIEIEDSTPDLIVVDDNYETESGAPVTGNVLDNDTGMDVFVTNHFDENGGIVTISSNGDFQFIPDDDFEGEAMFRYAVEDACGSLDTALVIVVVNAVDCTFEAQFLTSNASCGLEDGNISTSVSPPGNYEYQWSDGSANINLENVQSGTYMLTITDIDLGCSLIFEETIGENPPEYVSNVSVMQPSCSVPADILFDLMSTGANQFVATVTHPNGIDAFVIPGGTVFLADYLSIVTGTYSISVYDTDAGPECAQTFSVLVEEPTELTIALLEIIPPSSPTGNDGAVVIEVVLPGIPPYAIWVNGDVWEVTTESEFIVSGLGVGPYTLFITDEVGCTSNELEFFVPPPMNSDFKIGMGFIAQLQMDEEHAELSISRPHYFVELTRDFNVFGVQFMGALRINESQERPMVALSMRARIFEFKVNKIQMTLNGGGMIQVIDNQIKNPFFSTELSAKLNLGLRVDLHFFIENGNQNQEPLRLGMKVRY